MKKLEVIIQPFGLEAVKEALSQLGLEEIITSEIKSYSGKGASGVFRGSNYTIDFVPRTKVEVTVPDAQIHPACSVIQKAAGSEGARIENIFVIHVDEVISICREVKRQKVA